MIMTPDEPDEEADVNLLEGHSAILTKIEEIKIMQKRARVLLAKIEKRLEETAREAVDAACQEGASKR